MNTDLLQQWLGLPAGGWPPDHYALLGLPRGPAAPELVEACALERMDLLRRYQLLHAEEVTEGMNRLAQALDVLTDPDARRAYNAALGIPVEAPPAPVAPAPPAPPAEEPEPPVVVVPVAAPPRREPARDRLGYEALRPMRKELARLRGQRRSWDRLGPFLADPRPSFPRRGELTGLVSALAEVRAAGAAPWAAGPDQPGAIVLALAREPFLAEHFRALPAPRREALADDWRRVRALLDERRDRLRDQLDGRRARRRFLRRLRRGSSALWARPEWLLPVGAALALLLALWRSS